MSDSINDADARAADAKTANPGDVIRARWEEVDRIFDRALRHPNSERGDVVKEECGGDGELIAAVWRLLEISESDDARLNAPGPELIDAALPPDDSVAGLKPGDSVDRYQILGELGRGGMATVYEAERSDGAYTQQVALKVLRRGLDTDRIVQRFLSERQILSGLAHPNVARLLDGGATQDGRPYLVMEKVDGAPITQWAEARGSSRRARLDLFLQCTDAVREAHRRLVVHRDLKPSNILVDESGCVKLLDFGIAKLLSADAETDLTEVGTYPLTMRYASPEQLRGDPVTTSSDVFQLGLLLHELLTGHWPLDPKTRLVETRLPGDLDVIVRKCLAEAPDDRYSSVTALADDVGRHLTGRPITARPANWVVRLSKWSGRNRWAAPVGALLLAGAVTYVGTLILGTRRLELERNQARAQADRAERIKGVLVDLFESSTPFAGADGRASADVTVAEALAPAVTRIRTDLQGDPRAQAELLASVASVLFNIDRAEESLPLIEESLAIRSSLGEEGSPEFATDLVTLSRIVRRQHWDSAAVLLHRAIGTLRSSTPPDDPRLASALSELLFLQISRIPPADPVLGEEAVAIYRASGDPYRGELAGVLRQLASVYEDADAAEDAALEGLRLAREAWGEEHGKTALAAVTLAGVYDTQRRSEEAAALYLAAIPVIEHTAGRDHNQTLAAKNNLATTYVALGRLTDALTLQREVLEAQRRVTGPGPDRRVAESLQNLAASLKALGRLREADTLSSQAHSIFLKTTAAGHPLRAFPLLTRAEIQLALNNPGVAASVAREALDVLESALPPGHYAVGVARCRLGRALVLQDTSTTGPALIRTGLQVLRADERTPPAYLEECVLFVDDLSTRPASERSR